MIAAYLRERFRPAVFVPLAIVMSGGAAAASFDFARIGFDVLFALLLLAEFRLWDDLADLPSDYAAHPGRVLVRAGSLRPFVAVLLGLAIVNTAVAGTRDDSGLSVSTLVALHGVLALWYAQRSRRTVAGDQLLLAKYPAFVVIIAGERAFTDPLTIGMAAGALYAAVSIYEAWHDPSSPVGMLIGGRS